MKSIQQQAGKAPTIGNSLKFNFGDQQIFIDGTGATNVVTAENKNADCTVNVSLHDFNALVTGKLNPMSAFMSGKLKVDGDMAVAMKLQSLFN